MTEKHLVEKISNEIVVSLKRERERQGCDSSAPPSWSGKGAWVPSNLVDGLIVTCPISNSTSLIQAHSIFRNAMEVSIISTLSLGDVNKILYNVV